MSAPTNENRIDFQHRLRRSPGRLGRNQNANARVNETELKELEAAASGEGKALSEWARDVLLREARRSKEDVLLTETIATRMLLLNLIKPLAKGQKVTEEYVTDLMATVRADKRKATQEVLQQYAGVESRES